MPLGWSHSGIETVEIIFIVLPQKFCLKAIPLLLCLWSVWCHFLDFLFSKFVYPDKGGIAVAINAPAVLLVGNLVVAPESLLSLLLSSLESEPHIELKSTKMMISRTAFCAQQNAWCTITSLDRVDWHVIRCPRSRRANTFIAVRS